MQRIGGYAAPVSHDDRAPTPRQDFRENCSRIPSRRGPIRLPAVARPRCPIRTQVPSRAPGSRCRSPTPATTIRRSRGMTSAETSRRRATRSRALALTSMRAA